MLPIFVSVYHIINEIMLLGYSKKWPLAKEYFTQDK